MEKLRLILTVVFTSLSCDDIVQQAKGLTTQNVLFYKTSSKSWKDAANFCLEKGGLMESNVTFLMNQFQFRTADVWLGKFELLTNWTYVRGCFLIGGRFQHFVTESANNVDLQCQMLCNNYKFYSIKGEDCYCIKDIDSFVRKQNCSCVGCYKVWEHFPTDRLSNVRAPDKRYKCIASQCAGGFIRLIYADCNTTYDVTCDNDAKLNYTYPNHQSASQECERRDSFIKFHSDNFCVTETGVPIAKHQYWTSGTRKNETFFLRKAYFKAKFKPETCTLLDNDHIEWKGKNCSGEHSFFCRFETDEDKGDMISIPNISMPQPSDDSAKTDEDKGDMISIPNISMPQPSDDSASIAAGTITAIIVVIVVISVFVFIHRRRLSRKKPPLHESQNSRLQVDSPSNHETSKSPVYHEIDAVNCSRAVNNNTYDQAPNSLNVNQSTTSSVLTNVNSVDNRKKSSQNGYEMAKVLNVTGNSSEGVIVGIVSSIIAIRVVLFVVIVYRRRRIHSRTLLSLSTVVKDETSTSRMDSNTVNAAYEQLNKTYKDNITHCQSYDQLIVHKANKTIKHNTRISREVEGKYESIEEPIEKYNDALTAEYEQLEQSEKAKTTNVYDPLHYTPVEDSDPTND